MVAFFNFEFSKFSDKLAHRTRKLRTGREKVMGIYVRRIGNDSHYKIDASGKTGVKTKDPYMEERPSGKSPGSTAFCLDCGQPDVQVDHEKEHIEIRCIHCHSSNLRFL